MPTATLSLGLHGRGHLLVDLRLQRSVASLHCLPVVIPVVVLGGSRSVVGVGCVLYGVLIERRWYRLVRHRLAILPADGSRDPDACCTCPTCTSCMTRPEKSRRFLAVAAPGRRHGGHRRLPRRARGRRDAWSTCCGPTRGRLASWFVLGSNDYFAPRPLNYFAYFQRHRKRRRAVEGPGRRPGGPARAPTAGRDLTNVRRDVDLDGLPVELLGLDDAHIRWQDYRVAPRRAPERFGFAVMHSPDSAPEAAALGYDLMVAGHTHGGQVCLPLRRRVGDELLDASPARQGRDPDGRRPCCTPRRAWAPASTRRSGSGAGPRPRCWSSAGGPRPARLGAAHRALDSLHSVVLGTWRSLVARSVRDAEVAGSNPAVPTRGTGGRARICGPSSVVFRRPAGPTLGDLRKRFAARRDRPERFDASGPGR